MTSPDEYLLPTTYWVVQDRLLAGDYPSVGRRTLDLARLTSLIDAAGITSFIDLTGTGEIPIRQQYKPLFRSLPGERLLHYHHMPITDMGVPSTAEMIAILDTIDQAPGRVYVHCYAGVGRTGTVVGCYLARHGLHNGNVLEAITLLRTGGLGDPPCPSPIRPAQCSMVSSWQLGM